jgi:hypothetical protein
MSQRRSGSGALAGVDCPTQLDGALTALRIGCGAIDGRTMGTSDVEGIATPSAMVDWSDNSAIDIGHAWAEPHASGAL